MTDKYFIIKGLLSQKSLGLWAYMQVSKLDLLLPWYAGPKPYKPKYQRTALRQNKGYIYANTLDTSQKRT